MCDWLDLNDWVLEHYPELHKATRYMTNMALQTECWAKVYRDHQLKNPT